MDAARGPGHTGEDTTMDEIRAIAASAFGLRADQIRALPGDLEVNRRIRGSLGDGEGTFLLRLYVSGLPLQTIEFQRDLVDHVLAKDPGLTGRLQRFLGQGNRIQPATYRGQEVNASLMEYLPGELLAKTTPHSPALLRDLGALLGRVDRALLDFDGEAAPAAEDPSWHLLDAPTTIDPRLASIEEGPTRRDLVARVLDRYREDSEAKVSCLRTSVTHHDANENNVLVEEQPGAQRVSGLIDFGDSIQSATVTEPAIAAAYAALGKRNPLGAMAQVISGYHSELPLTAGEFEVLFDLAMLRLATSVAVSSHRFRSGEASEYQLISQGPAWAALETLGSVHPRFAAATFRAAAGLTPVPRSAAFVQWAASETFSPVLGTSLAAAPRVDLSVASPLLVDGAFDRSMASWGQLLESIRQEAGALATVGYHGEARRLYAASDAFAVPGEDGPEPRTIHLGVDLFAPAGTSVLAPLGGRVLSVQRNGSALDYGPTLILEHAPQSTEVRQPFWTLYGHLDGEVLDRLKPGDPVEKGEVIARMGAESENGGWPPHLHFQVILDRLGLSGDFPGVAAPGEREVWEGFCPDPAPLLGLESCAAPRTPTPELTEARRRNFCRSMSISYDRPLQMVKGRGTTLIDADGLPYLDAVNNVPHVGHCHPRVVEAGQRQMALLNANTRYLSVGLERYASKLRAKLPNHLEVIYFVSSGSEANEVALRLAQAATGGARDVLVQEHGYHGHTGATVSRSHYKFAGRGGFDAPEEVHVVPVPDPFRGVHRGPDSGPLYVQGVEEVLARLTGAGRRPCAMLAEAIIGCGGQVVPPEGYLRGAFEAVRKAGGVAIADEVQVGFGRVGTHFWAFDEQDAVPDIVTMGKPIGNAHPLAAVATTRAIADAFAGGMEFFATFGGNHVSAAVGEAVLDVIDAEDLLANVRARSAQFFREMAPIAERHPCIGDVRGRGLYLGVDLVRDRETLEPWEEAARHTANRLRDRRILVSTDGPSRNVLKIKPPIVFSEEEMTRLTQAIDRTLGESAIRSAGPKAWAEGLSQRFNAAAGATRRIL